MTSLEESKNLSSEREFDFLRGLLESKEINALVNVHSKVGKINKDEKCAPLMASSLQVCINVTNIYEALLHNSVKLIKNRWLSKYWNNYPKDVIYLLFVRKCFICYKHHIFR